MKKKEQTSVSTSMLINDVTRKFDEIPSRILKNIVKEFLNSIENHVGDGKKIRLDKLGILTVKEAAARQGRNPQTGETIQIAARKKIGFSASKTLKSKVSKKS